MENTSNNVPPIKTEGSGESRGRQRRKILRLKDIFANAVLMELFTDHLEATLCAENLLFFQAAEKYQKCGSDDERRVMYNEIVKKFLLPESEHTMDCPDHIAAAILVAPDPPPLDVFDEMMIEAYGVLSRDSLQRFLASAQYKAYLENPPDSPRTRRMRKKAEKFFGESILGPLKREEVLRLNKSRTKLRVRRTADGRILSITRFGWAKSIKQKEPAEAEMRSNSVGRLSESRGGTSGHAPDHVRNPKRGAKVTVDDRQRVSSEPYLDNWDLQTASECSPSPPEVSPRTSNASLTPAAASQSQQKPKAPLTKKQRKKLQKEQKKAEKAARKAAKATKLTGGDRNQRANTEQVGDRPGWGSPKSKSSAQAGSGMFGGAPSGSGMFGGAPSGSGMFGGAPSGSGMFGGAPSGSGTQSKPPVPSGTKGEDM